jgi:hypothetical protein
VDEVREKVLLLRSGVEHGVEALHRQPELNQLP